MLGSRVKHEIKWIRPVSVAELERFHIALNQLGNYGSYCGLYEICDKNYNSIISYLLSIKDEFPKNRHRLHEYLEESLQQEINRLLLNYLSSFRTFVDHLETRYKRLRRQDCSLFEDYEKMISACRYSSFSYRFFWKFRNYVQHCGLPPMSIRIREGPSSDGGIDTIITISLNRDALINGYKKWGEVKDELKRQPEYMEFPSYVKALQSQIQLIYTAMSGIEISLANDSWQYLYNLVHEVQSKFGNVMPFIGCQLMHNEGQLQLQITDFPLHTMAKFQANLKEINDFQERQKAKDSSN
jgi:hypothetical protein